MRSILFLFLSIAVVQTQFGLSTAISTTTTPRRMNWVRKKVTRLQQWAGLRKTTVPHHRISSTTPAPHKSSRFLDRWKSTTRGFPVTPGFGESSMIPEDPKSTSRGLPGAGIPAPRHSESSGFLDRVKRKLGLVAVVPVISPHHSDTRTTVILEESTTTTTTQKSFIDRAKEKLGFTTTSTTTVVPVTVVSTPGFFSRSFSKIKSLLRIGSTDPEKPNLVVKYGKKAVEKLGPKLLEKIKKNFHGMSSFFSTDEEFPTQLQNFEGRTQTEIRVLKEKVEKLERLVEGLQSVLLKDWNVTESGSKYRLFEERKNWDNAESHCQGYGAHLAIIDNEAKNNFVTGLVNSSSTSDFAWIGMKTKTTTQKSTFTNFDSESPIDGCAVLDSKGVWSIRSCIQLRPFVCQIVKNLVQ